MMEEIPVMGQGKDFVVIKNLATLYQVEINYFFTLNQELDQE